MSFSIRIMERNFQNPLTLPKVDFKPERYSFHAIGGPKSATIQIKGANERAVWELLEYLRCPVEILDDRESCVWWGYVNSVEINVGSLKVGVSLEEMHNQIAVMYSEGNAKAMTAFAYDGVSVATYGTKELVATLSEANQAMAEAFRSNLLNAAKYPIPIIDITDRRSDLTATLNCFGWFRTLDWKYYARSGLREAYDIEGIATQDVGRASTNQRIAQSFYFDDQYQWSLANVRVRCRKIGSPGDGLIMEVCASSANQPGTVIASYTLNNSEISTSLGWVDFPFYQSGFVQLSPNTTYWLVLRRSGGLDNNNYYVVGVNEQLGYNRGIFRLFNGSTWASRSPDADMNFQLTGYLDNTIQIGNIIDSASQFLTGWELRGVTAGVVSDPARNGDTTALHNLVNLLSTGNNRLLATITRDRRLIVYPEPAPDPYRPDIYLLSDGSVQNIWGDPSYATTCPVGVWARLKDVIPGSVDLGLIADPTMLFIEEAEYDIENRRYLPTTRLQNNPLSVGTRMRDG